VNAYIFGKSDRVIFNHVENVKEIQGNEIRSETEVFTLIEDHDFFITNNEYSMGDLVSENEINKSLPLSPIEQLQKDQAELTFQLMMNGVL
jgi:hypothetical protein